jgi:hypothetical protein
MSISKASVRAFGILRTHEFIEETDASIGVLEFRGAETLEVEYSLGLDIG